MSVITISRGSYSGGKMLAESVARRLGYRCIDRDLIVRRAAESGISEQDLRAALEKPPSFLGHSRHTAYLYVAIIQAALTDEVRTGNVVYHGLAGHLLLKGAAHVLRARLIAPLEVRLRMVQQRQNVERKEAIAYIQKMDEGRRAWTRLLYGVDWADPSLYDVVLNLDRLTIEGAADVLVAMVKQPCFQPTAETEKAVDEMAIASRIRAKLATDASTSELELEVSVHDGAALISGRVLGVEQTRQINRIARDVGGVSSVKLQVAHATRM